MATGRGHSEAMSIFIKGWPSPQGTFTLGSKNHSAGKSCHFQQVCLGMCSSWRHRRHWASSVVFSELLTHWALENSSWQAFTWFPSTFCYDTKYLWVFRLCMLILTPSLQRAWCLPGLKSTCDFNIPRF